MLPTELQEAVLALTESVKMQELSDARARLTGRYKGPRGSGRLIQSHAERLSYLLTRLPATYAAVEACLESLQAVCPQLEVQSLLDAGAGPGTASWAATQHFATIRQCTLLEFDHELAKIGKKLASNSSNDALAHAEWVIEDLLNAAFAPHDLVICSYALGEISPSEREKLIANLWQNTNKVLLLIEPGSMEGFSCIRSAREFLLQQGARLAAPCPHAYKCPMPANDWCHFSTRLERTWMHKQLKGGALGYEDEKFSYIAAVKNVECQAYYGRVISPPEKHSGHLRLGLCSDKGLLELKTVSRKEGELYKQAKKLDWGSIFKGS